MNIRRKQTETVRWQRVFLYLSLSLSFSLSPSFLVLSFSLAHTRFLSSLTFIGDTCALHLGSFRFLFIHSVKFSFPSCVSACEACSEGFDDNHSVIFGSLFKFPFSFHPSFLPRSFAMFAFYACVLIGCLNFALAQHNTTIPCYDHTGKAQVHIPTVNSLTKNDRFVSRF